MSSAGVIESEARVNRAIQLFDAGIGWRLTFMVLTPSIAGLMTQDTRAALVALVLVGSKNLLWLHSLYSQAVK